MKKKTAERWMRRKHWKISAFKIGVFSFAGSRFHKDLLKAQRALGSILFRSFRS